MYICSYANPEVCTCKFLIGNAVHEILYEIRGENRVQCCYTSLLSAVGEPPQCVSCAAMFAVKRAIFSARKENGNEDYFTLCQ